MNVNQQMLSVILTVLVIGFIAYVYVRWLRKPKKQQAIEKPPPIPPKKRFSRAAVIVFTCGVIGGFFLVPEWMGRKDATAVCESIPVGTQLQFDQESLSAYRDELKSRHGTLHAASYYPKIKGINDGNGAIILVFVGGHPFSRAYCVLNMQDSVVESKRLMFNAEDYTYCNGEMRGVWECKD